MVSTRTGWKVPAPTCNVTNAISTPLARNFSSKGSSKCRPAVGLQPRPVFRYKRFDKVRGQRLLATVDIRRQRHMADAVENIQHRAFIIKFDFKQCAVARGLVALILSSSPSSGSAPGFGAFEARICARMRLSSSIRSTSTSILHPLALRPNRRAGIARCIIKNQKNRRG